MKTTPKTHVKRHTKSVKVHHLWGGEHFKIAGRTFNYDHNIGAFREAGTNNAIPYSQWHDYQYNLRREYSQTHPKPHVWKGYVIARKLIDDDGKTKPFTYYPQEFDAKPPYFYKNKHTAEKAYERMKRRDEFPANEKNAILVKYKPSMYLNRY